MLIACRQTVIYSTSVNKFKKKERKTKSCSEHFEIEILSVKSDSRNELHVNCGAQN